MSCTSQRMRLEACRRRDMRMQRARRALINFEALDQSLLVMGSTIGLTTLGIDEAL